MDIYEYKRLCSALLINGLEDFCKGGSDGEDALSWINNTTDEYLFDFVVVCRSLGIDSERIRDAVRCRRLKPLLDEFKSSNLSRRASECLHKHTKPAKLREQGPHKYRGGRLRGSAEEYFPWPVIPSLFWLLRFLISKLPLTKPTLKTTINSITYVYYMLYDLTY